LRIVRKRISNTSAVSSFVVDFPTLPVIPTMRTESWLRQCRPIAWSAASELCTRRAIGGSSPANDAGATGCLRSITRPAAGTSRSITATEAPRSNAAATYSCPSACSPLSAMKRAPGITRRESIAASVIT
jgi:hypothetical protein